MQERDAERRRQLRERARQLIAEARSGVKMSDMSLLDVSSTERGKGGKAGPAGGQHTHTHTEENKQHNSFLDIFQSLSRRLINSNTKEKSDSHVCDIYPNMP